MALTQRLEIRQSHALVMTPQLMQAIKLLQLSNLDLAAYVEGELERNPLLERVGKGSGAQRVVKPPRTLPQPIGRRTHLTEAAPQPRNSLAPTLRMFPPPTPMLRPRARTARRRRAIPSGPAPARAGAIPATTISKPSSPSRTPPPIISPSPSPP